MKKSIPSKILILLLLFQAVSAIPAGFALISDPSGAKLGLPIALLKHSPFPDFLIPGLFLFLVLGIFPTIVLYGLIKRNRLSVAEKINLYKDYHWSWTFSYYVGLILILWINMQLFFLKEFDILHFVYSILGVLIILFAQLPTTKKDYLDKT